MSTIGHISGCISHKQVETGDTNVSLCWKYKLGYHLGKIRTHWHTKTPKIRTHWHTKKAEKDTHSSGTCLAFIYPKLPPPPPGGAGLRGKYQYSAV